MDSVAKEGVERRKYVIDSGASCLCIILAFHGIRVDAAHIAHHFSTTKGKVDSVNLVRAARQYDLKAKTVCVSMRRLNKMPLPALAESIDGQFFIIAKIVNENVLIQQSGEAPQQITMAELATMWNGNLILFARRAGSILADVNFGFRWFWPVIVRYKTLFIEVLTASFFLQLFALVTPLFFQVIIDKVLVHRGMTTLDVLITGLIGLIIFEVILGFLRTYVFSHTTSRVDAQLGAQLFRHMLALPITYFESRPVGQTVARIRELENIRDFLTGSALTLVIDLFFTIVFFIVMWLFSPALTLIVLAAIPLYIVLSLAITPTLRKRVEEKFYRGAINQSFLVESITGAETLKAMAVEPQMHNRWDENLAAYVHASFRTIALGAFGSQAVMLINKVTMAVVLWFGARLVMNGELTIGQLVAFNMLAGQVSQPIVRIAQLWQNFQQFRISIQRLGDILNTKTERKQQSVVESGSTVQGHIVFDNVTFRYRVDEPEVLKKVSFSIGPDQIVGVVGRSGSGKSTITKLIQRLHVPQNGRVLIDGVDIALLDPAWLRRQIGVVLQDSILFHRTVRENIALAQPAATMERVMQAAQLAGAHEFILQLPRGYDTLVEERGTNLSGGQRQRIAIARALMTAPRILIFDEATAALDYESERVFQQNLRKIARQRTVILVAHRLSTVREADAIIVMESGRVAEMGSHDALMAAGSVYASLVQQHSIDKT